MPETAGEFLTEAEKRVINRRARQNREQNRKTLRDLIDGRTRIKRIEYALQCLASGYEAQLTFGGDQFIPDKDDQGLPIYRRLDREGIVRISKLIDTELKLLNKVLPDPQHVIISEDGAGGLSVVIKDMTKKRLTKANGKPTNGEDDETK